MNNENEIIKEVTETLQRNEEAANQVTGGQSLLAPVIHAKRRRNLHGKPSPEKTVGQAIKSIEQVAAEENSDVKTKIIDKSEYAKKVDATMKGIMEQASDRIQQTIGNANAAQAATVYGIVFDKHQSLEGDKALSRDKEIEGILKIDGRQIDLETARLIFKTPSLRNIGEIMTKVKRGTSVIKGRSREDRGKSAGSGNKNIPQDTYNQDDIQKA